MYRFDTFKFLIVLVVWKCLVTLRLLGILRHLRNSRLLLLDKKLEYTYCKTWCTLFLREHLENKEEKTLIRDAL